MTAPDFPDRFVYRSASPERYHPVPFLIFVTAPLLLSSPWWVVLLWMLGVWFVARLGDATR